MKTLAFIAVSAMLGASLSGCAGLGAGTSGLTSQMGAILTDPNCAHHDEVQGVTGAAGIPASLQFKVVRDCPAKAPAPAPAAPAVP